MASAVEKVFGIPELLEHILVLEHTIERVEFQKYTPLNNNKSFFKEDPITKESRFRHPAMHLFILQRVNRTFEQTILGSAKLRYSMGLKYDEKRLYANLPKSRPPWSNSFFLLLDPQARVGTQLEKGYAVQHMNLAIHPSATCNTNVALRPSWHRIKLARYRVATEIRIKVYHSPLNRLFGTMCYIKLLHLDEGSGTLGDVAEIFDTIKRRSLLRHWLAAQCPQRKWEMTDAAAFPAYGFLLCMLMAFEICLILSGYWPKWCVESIRGLYFLADRSQVGLVVYEFRRLEASSVR